MEQQQQLQPEFDTVWASPPAVTNRMGWLPPPPKNPLAAIGSEQQTLLSPADAGVAELATHLHTSAGQACAGALRPSKN